MNPRHAAALALVGWYADDAFPRGDAGQRAYRERNSSRRDS